MCVCVCVCACVRACVRACVCGQASRSRVMDSFVFKQQVLFRVDFLSVTLDHRIKCPRLGLGVKILDILKNLFFFAFVFLLCNQSYLKNRYYSGLTFSL